jgi:hypothetical protein
VPRGSELGSRAAQEIESRERPTADLILNMLRAIRGKQDQHDQKFDEVITRLGALERDFAGMKLDFAGVHARLDNIGRRLDRVERRLELVGEPASLDETASRRAFQVDEFDVI